MASVLRGRGEPIDNPRKQQKETKIVACDSIQIPAYGVGNPFSLSHDPIDALLTSRDSLGLNRCIDQVNADGDDVPGYTRFNNRVKISLNSRSRSGINELTTKLKGELDQVRSFVKKFEAQEPQISGYDGDVGRSHSQFSANNFVKNVGCALKVNSEAGSVDVPASGLVRCVPEAENFGLFAEKEMNRHKNSKEFRMSVCDSNRGKIGPVLKSCKNLVERLMKHKYGWVFNVPVDAKRLGLHDYHKIIMKPMDLGTVKMRLNKNWYKSPREFAEDVRLTFSNAITYNPKGEDVYVMAEQLSKIFEEEWRIIEAKQNAGNGYQKDDGSVLPTPTSRKSPALAMHPAESRTFSRLEPTKKPTSVNRGILGEYNSITIPPNPQKNPTNVGHSDEKPKVKNNINRDMTYEEKQKLSIDLQDLPSDKLNNVVKIIKKRNQGLFQNDDEIELDIDSVDSETLWELERFVADYKKSLIKNKRKVDDDLQSGKKLSQYLTECMDRAVANAGEPVGDNADSEGDGDSSSTRGDANQSPSDRLD